MILPVYPPVSSFRLLGVISLRNSWAGQEAIRYYLERDPAVQFFQLPVPSCKTIDRILQAHERIAQHGERLHQPLERPSPMSAWQIDFKDVSSVPADPDGKRQHVVETLNIIDTGTSVLLDAHVRADFTAETALEALASTLAKYGRPQRITLDRDSRWVGSPQGSDFPAALLRFGACLGIEIEVCEPHHPQQNAFVERPAIAWAFVAPRCPPDHACRYPAANGSVSRKRPARQEGGG